MVGYNKNEYSCLPNASQGSFLILRWTCEISSQTKTSSLVRRKCFVSTSFPLTEKQQSQNSTRKQPGQSPTDYSCPSPFERSPYCLINQSHSRLIDWLKLAALSGESHTFEGKRLCGTDPWKQHLGPKPAQAQCQCSPRPTPTCCRAAN